MATQANGATDWMSFDPVAETYDRLMVPIFFARPSADLVDDCSLNAGDRVLDVGAGTGVTAVLAAQAIGPEGVVAGIDPSIMMLQQARRRGLSRVVVGGLPHLPFPDSVFDVVMSSFVLGNILDYRAGLREMIRVLRPGGTIGVTTWGPDAAEFGQLWKDVSAAFVSPQHLQSAKVRRIPWQEHFTREANLRQALQDAALETVSVRERIYHLSMRHDEYLASRQSFAEGRLLRHILGETKWEEFCRAVAGKFQTQYGQGIEYDRSVFFGIARKPAP
jgi:ubiquinone/menaquinone biosynthesis C-methylase UbiE